MVLRWKKAWRAQENQALHGSPEERELECACLKENPSCAVCVKAILTYLIGGGDHGEAVGLEPGDDAKELKELPRVDDDAAVAGGTRTGLHQALVRVLRAVTERGA